MNNIRSEIFNTLKYRINSFADGYRQNIAIIGEPYIGKTSLIKNLFSSGCVNRESIIPIYLEVKIEPFEFCVKRFIKSALYQLLQTEPLLARPGDTILLIDDLESTHPKTAQICTRVLQDVERNKYDDAYSYMMDIPAVIHEETGKKSILILDEFHNLENFSLRHALGTLAKKIMIQKDTMYLLLSSRETISQRLLSEKLSMLFGNFEKIFIPPFNLNMSRDFIRDYLCVTSFPQVYFDFIATFSGNKPFYMKRICDEIKKGIYGDGIEPDNHNTLIEHAIVEAVFKKNGVINQLFSNLLGNVSDGKLSSKTAAVLIALSSENKKQNDIASSSKLQMRDISRILNKLVELDIVVRNGSMFRIKEKLFSFWLKSVYLKRIMSFSIDETVEESCFRKEIRGLLEGFIREYEKELAYRIADLLRLFKNDVIQLNGRRHKFVSFDEIQMLEKGVCDAANILAKNPRRRWFCIIKKEYVTENDIAEIIKDMKRYKRTERLHKKILIALGGMNENAYLMAKESKLWVWDTQSVNILMELYGKPHIIPER